MARHRMTSQGKRKAYTATEQKKITMNALGLDEKDKADNRIYKSLYDDVARRVRQYNILQDLHDKSKLRPADVLFDIVQYRKRSGDLTPPTNASIKNDVLQNSEFYTPTIKNLYNQKLVSNTRLYAERIRANSSASFQQALDNELNVFNVFLNTKGVNNDLQAYNDWMNEPVNVYIDKETGEIFTEEQATGANGLIDLERFAESQLPRGEVITDIKEVRDFLKRLAADRKRSFKRVYTDRENNIYHYEVSTK